MVDENDYVASLYNLQQSSKKFLNYNVLLLMMMMMKMTKKRDCVALYNYPTLFRYFCLMFV